MFSKIDIARIKVNSVCSPEQFRILLTGKTDCRGVDNGQKFCDITCNDSMGKHNISVIKASDINKFFNITFFLLNDLKTGSDLIFEGFYSWRQITAEFKCTSFIDRKSSAFTDVVEAQDIKTFYIYLCSSGFSKFAVLKLVMIDFHD